MSWLVLDASKYQTFTSYAEAAEDLDGVVLRCGLRGYNSGFLAKDSKIETHYNGFYGKRSRSGNTIRVGFYWFSAAINELEAIEEADYIDNILSSKTSDFPIYIESDYGSSDMDGRADSLSKEDRTAYTLALANRLIELGRTAGVIASEEWFNDHLEYDTLKDAGLSLWIRSNDVPVLEDYDGWRYTTTGIISGISARVSLTNFYNDVANWEDTKIDINTLNPWIISPVTYNGTMENTSTVGIDGLTYLVDYTVSWYNIATAGDLAYAIVKGIGNYYGEKKLSYVISPANIGSVNISLNKDGWRYTGEEIEPTLVIDRSTPLGESCTSSQYTVEYSDNILPGAGKCKVTGKNNFTGVTTLTFFIDGEVPFPMDPYLEETECPYTGEMIEPKVIIGNLVEDEDFIVEYENNVVIGTALARVTGIDNYVGNEAELYFEIVPFNIATATSVRYSQSRYTFTGYAINPTFAVSVSKGDLVIDLVENVDYYYTVKNNIEAGTATITITGQGNFTGTHYANFTIYPANLSDCTVYTEKTKYEYTGEPIEPAVYVNLNGFRVTGNSYTLTYYNNTKIGTDASVVVSGKNNLTGNTRVNFEIVKKATGDVWVLDETDFIYDGQGKFPVPRCITSDPIPEVDFTVGYQNNVDAGRGYCIVVMQGHYDYSRVRLAFTIHPQPVEEGTFKINGTEFKYNGDYIEPGIICNNEDMTRGRDYKIQYFNNKYPDGDAYALVTCMKNYEGIFRFDFHISSIDITEEAHIDMGEPVKYPDMYDPKNFKVVANDRTLVLYDDYIYDFKTITFPKNITYQYTVYIVTGIGAYSGTIQEGFYTTVEGYEPEIPKYIPRNITGTTDNLVTDEVDDTPVEEEEKDLGYPTYIDPYALSENFIPDIEPVIPDDPDWAEYKSGTPVYIRKCNYYSSPYTKYPEKENLNGTFFIFDWRQVNGKIRITLDANSAKIVGQTTGWIKVEEIKNFFHVNLGDEVTLISYMYADRWWPDGGKIYKKPEDKLYVTYIEDPLYSSMEIGIGLSSKSNLSPIGWASIDMLNIP